MGELYEPVNRMGELYESANRRGEHCEPDVSEEHLWSILEKVI